MLIIRKAQLDALSEYVLKSFESRSVKYLMKKYPGRTREMNEEDMLKFVKGGIEKAAEYDIVEREDVLPFLEYMVFYGIDFETNPEDEWATDIFRMSTLRGDEKIRQLRDKKPLGLESE